MPLAEPWESFFLQRDWSTRLKPLSLSQVHTWLTKRKAPTMPPMQTRPSLTPRVATLGWTTRKSTSSSDPSFRTLYLQTLQFTQSDGGKQGNGRTWEKKTNKNKVLTCWNWRTSNKLQHTGQESDSYAPARGLIFTHAYTRIWVDAPMTHTMPALP